MNTFFLGAIFTTLHILHNKRIGPKARVFVRGKPLQPNVMLNSILLGPFLSYKENEVLEKGNTRGGSITVLLTCCLAGLDYSVLQIKTKFFSSDTADSKPVKQEVNAVILPPLVFPGWKYDHKLPVLPVNNSRGCQCLPEFKHHLSTT